MSIAASFGLCLAVIAADVEVGDKMVTLTTAPVMSSSQKLTEVAPGAELTVTGLKLPWVGITVAQDGKEVRGWVLDRHLMLARELSQLLDLFRRRERLLAMDQSPSDERIGVDDLKRFTEEPGLPQNAETAFKLIDRDGDGKVALSEFANQPYEAVCLRLDGLSFDRLLAATQKPELSELNDRLRTQINSAEKKRLAEGFFLKQKLPAGEMIDLMLHMDFPRQLIQTVQFFEGWQQGKSATYDQSHQMMQEFMRTGDLRRSRLARELVGTETAEARRQMVRALFLWLDRNHDGSLAAAELRVALERQESTGKKPSVSSDRESRSQVATRQEANKKAGSEVTTSISALTRQLRGGTLSVQLDAVAQLEEMGTEAKAAIPAIIEGLEHGNLSLQLRILGLLEKMGPEAKEAVPTLIGLLNGTSLSLRRKVMGTLPKLGPEAQAAVPALKALLQDKNRSVRGAAQEALQKIESS
jgi:Ca2+-binding EF-hand superfamily protein